MGKMTNKDINQMIIRNNAARLTFNYESLQTIGIMRAMAPALRKIYGDDKEGLAKAMKRHLVFCNSHAFWKCIYNWFIYRNGRTNNRRRKRFNYSLENGFNGATSRFR